MPDETNQPSPSVDPIELEATDFPDQFFAFHSSDSDESDEPWSEADLDGDPHFDHTSESDVLSFDTSDEPLDFNSRERWLQSCLRRLVNPKLAVDGKPGRGTRRALRSFQKYYRKHYPDGIKLSIDGIIGPNSTAALEQCTQSRAPEITESEYQAKLKQDTAAPQPDIERPAPATTDGPLTVSKKTVNGKRVYTISGHGEEVSFRYKTRERLGAKGKLVTDSYNVSRYRGGKTDLLSDEDLNKVGYTTAEIKILKANALKESGGKFGAINTWDNQIVSWGMAQFAGHAGSLAGLMRAIKEDAPRAFAKHFTAVGIDIDTGPYPYYNRKNGKKDTKKGAHVVITTKSRTYLGDDGWSYMRTQPKLLGAMMIAGNDPEIQLAQCIYWKRVFLDRAVNTVIGARRNYSVTRVIGRGRSRREQVLLAPTRSRAEWEDWAARPQNHIGGKNLATEFSNTPRSKLVINDPTTTGAKIRITVEKTGGAAVREYVTSEYGLGLIARLYNWMPAYVRRWSNDFIAVLEAHYPGRDIRDPDTWDSHRSLETEFRELIKDRRREVKKGSYDTYGLDLNQARGSFYYGTELAREHVDTAFTSFASEMIDVSDTGDDDDETIIWVNDDGDSEPDGADDRQPAPPPTIDPATLAPDVDVTHKSPTKKRKRKRKWSKITGITLHQTGIHNFGARAWHKVTAHLGVHSDGRVFHIHPLESYLWASNGFNRDTIAIEVAGNFLRDENKPNSYWKKGGGPTQLNEAMIAGLRKAVRYIMAEVAAHGGQITHIHAHRQTKKAKAACPGAAIWQNIGVWAQAEFGLSDGGPGYTRGDGQPIPSYWDPRLLEGPLSFSEEDEFYDDDAFGAEIDVEHPDEDDLTSWSDDHTTRSGGIIQINALPGGTKLSEQDDDDADAPTSRGDLDFSGPLDLDDSPEEFSLSNIFEQALADGGLTFVDQIVLEPEADAPTSRGDFDGDDSLDFEITVEEDEAALVLLEQDGLYRWVLPDSGDDEPTSRASDFSRGRFRIPLDDLSVAGDEDGDEEGTGQTRGFISNALTGGVRALVYKYVLSNVAELATDYILSKLDGQVREGPVIIDSDSLDEWRDEDDLSSLQLPSDRPARVLLFVHGTFSSTRSSFGALAVPGAKVLGPALADYDAIFGVDHRTLSRWPAENAKAIADLLVGDRWPHPPQIDVVSFSRGGLVARTLIERELPSRPQWQGTIVRALFVATTNAGTELARAENWNTLADLLTSLSNVGATALSLIPGAGTIASVIGREVISGVAGFLKELANIGLTKGKIPGLAAMDPSSEVVTNLNETPLPAKVTAQYFGMNSRFEPGMGDSDTLPDGIKNYLASRACKKLYRNKASDLVVHNQSTQTLHPEIAYTKFHHFKTNSIIFHTNFFAQDTVRELVREWLDLPEELDDIEELDISVDDFLPQDEDEWDEMDIPLDFSAEVPGDDDMPLSFGDTDDDTDITLYMQSSAPREVSERSLFSVHVTLSREEIAEAIAGEPGVDATGTVDSEDPIEVEVVARRGVELAGYERIQVGVPPETGNIGVFFRVRALDRGDAQLWVLVHQHGRVAIRSIVDVRVVARAAHALAPKVVVGDDLPAFDPSMAPADPSLEVIEMRGSDGLRFRYQLTSQRLGLNHRFESPRITADAETYFGDLYLRIEKEWKTANQNPRMFQRLLRALGTQLGEQLWPRELRIKLWELRDQIKGMQILSDETYIPWEIVHLKHPDQPLTRKDSYFLGQLGLTRSLWESTPASKILVRQGRARTLVPTYPNRRLALPQAQAERDWVAQRFASSALPPTSEDVLDALEQAGDFDLLHIACHGDLADRDAWLILEGSTRKGKWYPDKLSASLVAATADLGEPNSNRPLVFLNACKVARQEELLSSACGWVPTLLRAGAGAVVAPMWKVGDSAAQKFSEGFYSALLKGASFARAAMAAREFARAQGDPTWLAYVIYAHPRCTLKVEQET